MIYTLGFIFVVVGGIWITIDSFKEKWGEDRKTMFIFSIFATAVYYVLQLLVG